VIIEEVSVFTKSYELKPGIKRIKYRKIIDAIIKKKKEPEKFEEWKYKDTTLDVIFLEEDPLHFMFVAALLFLDVDYKVIASYVGVKEDVIRIFEFLFFDRKFFRGVLSKINFFKKLLASDSKEEQELGIVLKAAYQFGKEYVEWKFGLTSKSTDPTSIVTNTFKDMYFKYMEKSFTLKPDEIHEHLKAGKQLISAALDIQKSQSSGSTVDSIKQYLVELNEQVKKDQAWIKEVEVLDVNGYNNIIENKEQG